MDCKTRQLSFMEEKTTEKGFSQGEGSPDIRWGSSGGAAAPLLEIKHNTVDKTETWEKETVEHVLVSCSCRSRFCPDCSTSQGIALRLRVQQATAKWKAVQMWTLTVDPELFDNDPQACFDHVRERKSIAEWVKALRKAGHLIDKHYFCVIEWQKNGFPHWHILLQAKKIPHEYASQMWDRNRPKHLEPPERCTDGKTRPGFGWILYSGTRAGQSVAHAVNYATKYCIKFPEDGFPDWVLDYEHRIDRYQVSQGFWSVNRERDCETPDKPEEDKHNTECDLSSTCDCPRCRGDEPKKNYRRTVRERIAACAQKCSVLLKRRKWDKDGNELKPDYSFAFLVDQAYEYAASDLKHYEHKRETVLTHKDYDWFRELMGIEDDRDHYTVFDPSLLWRQDGAHYNGPNYEEYIIN